MVATARYRKISRIGVCMDGVNLRCQSHVNSAWRKQGLRDDYLESEPILADFASAEKLRP